MSSVKLIHFKSHRITSLQTNLRSSSPSSMLRHGNRLTPSHRFISAPPHHMPKPPQASFPHSILYGGNTHSLSDPHISNSIQNRWMGLIESHPQIRSLSRFWFLLNFYMNWALNKRAIHINSNNISIRSQLMMGWLISFYTCSYPLIL